MPVPLTNKSVQFASTLDCFLGSFAMNFDEKSWFEMMLLPLTLPRLCVSHHSVCVCVWEGGGGGGRGDLFLSKHH